MTVHSVMSFYRDPEGQLHRHSILMLSNDAAHDHHTVNTLMRRAIRFLQSMLPDARSLDISLLKDTEIMSPVSSAEGLVRHFSQFIGFDYPEASRLSEDGQSGPLSASPYMS
ncbi:hypothetical protein PoB_002452400 [Plakobranchus ocellatus]|uniref:Uncharacterized protein n=1 Tax=Plakobranchus ocellatus TaxID=259542 RepID=A0AAV3ZVU1_9GAST|nr:hypothetical protein PoB_002452400 [Plakobranchus ocellatus]